MQRRKVLEKFFKIILLFVVIFLIWFIIHTLANTIMSIPAFEKENLPSDNQIKSVQGEMDSLN